MQLASCQILLLSTHAYVRAVAGQEMSLVATDVQGSTELWEWNNFVADSAMVTHDETMRNQLGAPPIFHKDRRCDPFSSTSSS